MNNDSNDMKYTDNMQMQDVSAFPPETPIGMAYVPVQKFRTVFDTAVALTKGTIFPELDKPWLDGKAFSNMRGNGGTGGMNTSAGNVSGMNKGAVSGMSDKGTVAGMTDKGMVSGMSDKGTVAGMTDKGTAPGMSDKRMVSSMADNGTVAGMSGKGTVSGMMDRMDRRGTMERGYKK